MKEFIKGNKIALILSTILLILIATSSFIGRSWYAYLSSDEMREYAVQNNIKTKFNGLLISKAEVEDIKRCYEIFYQLLLKDPSVEKRESTANILQEYLNSLLVEANMLSNKIVLNEQINTEADYLYSLVLEQAKRKEIDLSKLYIEYNVTEADLLKCLNKQAVLRLAKKNLEDEKKISDEEAEKYYQENKDNYVSPTKVEAIIITLSNKKVAEEVWKDINNGNDFYDVLVKYHAQYNLPSKTQKIWVKEGQLNAALEKEIFDMGIGEKRGIVTTSEGYHIIKVENVVKSQLLEFEAIIDIVKADISELYVISKWKEYITQLRDHTRIIVWR